MASISCTPENVLVDSTPLIKAIGLKPNEKYTMTLHFKEEKREYLSVAHYVSNDDGMISNMHSTSIGGTFTGE